MLNIINIKTEDFSKKNPNIEIFEDDYIYLLYFYEKNIGYAIINENKKKYEIIIHIFKEYQGNGYGTYLFKEMLKQINKELILAIEIDNYKMIRIISRCGGKELGKDGSNVFFLIPKYNNAN